jgi:hypothetical protein
MAKRNSDSDFLSAFLGGNRFLESVVPDQQIAAPSFKSASRPLHTGYIRPLHLTGVDAKVTAKFQKVSEEDFWDARSDAHLSQLHVESLPDTAAKVPIYRDVASANSKSTTFSSFEACPSNPAFDDQLGSVDSVMNRVRPGIKLNRVQSSVKACIFNSNESSVVGAPTGKIRDAHC